MTREPLPPPPHVSAESRSSKRARALLRHLQNPQALRRSPSTVLRLVCTLETEGSIRYARQLVGLLRASLGCGAPRSGKPTRFETSLAALYATLTYQDPDLAADGSLDRALDILRTVDPLNASTKASEIISAVGGIFKRRWFLDGHTEHLESALTWYRRGYADQYYGSGLPADLGANWTNAGFALDQLAWKEEDLSNPNLSPPAAATARREEARTIRLALISRLRQPKGKGRTRAVLRQASPECRWTYLINLAESYLGLREPQKARRYLRLARATEERDRRSFPPGALETAVRHLVHVVRLNHPRLRLADLRQCPEWLSLEEFSGVPEALSSLFEGKVGLALSGGGFRAAFFHIGVLAYLAERDMLRRVEVLSCVSGGSVIGAYYYLKLRDLYMNGGPRSGEDYLDIVHQIHNEFHWKVRHNIRARALAGLRSNLSLIFVPFATRTAWVGELLDRFVFSPIAAPRRWKVRELAIQVDGAADFKPRRDNWKRAHKVPILVLNATTLNTGHNWQFAATWMGEPPNEANAEIDANVRLRRLYYGQAPHPELRDITLGTAVASSACVPVLFEPVALPRLYKEPWASGPEPKKRIRAYRVPERGVTPRLVDGGVHDNQGIASLVEQNCSVLLVSDASGQMSTENRPRTDPLGVLRRTNKILQARVRAAQYQELRARRRAGLIRSFMFVHLTKDLGRDALDWVNCREPTERDVGCADEVTHDTSYGVRREFQQLMANIRTDLDSFSETEACALMYSGYQMARSELVKHFQEMEPPPSLRSREWRFLRLRPVISADGGGDPEAVLRFRRALQISCHNMFKVWRDPGPRALAMASGCILVGLFALDRMTAPGPGITMQIQSMSPSVFRVAAALPWQILVWGTPGAVAGWALVRYFYFGERAGQILTGIALGTAGLVMAPWARLHLHVFHHYYLDRGKLARVLGEPSLRTGLPGVSRLKRIMRRIIFG